MDNDRPDPSAVAATPADPTPAGAVPADVTVATKATAAKAAPARPPRRRPVKAAPAAMSEFDALIAPEPAPVRTPVAAHPTGDVIRIGRHADNDVVLPDLRASQFHAEIHRIGDQYVLIDMASTNGVHLNGRAVTRAVLNPGDRVSIMRHDFVFDGSHLHEFIDNGPASLFADDLTVQAGKATLLDDVTFAVQQGSLVGVIGPSGCGKSTLIKAITGLRPADQGRVHYDGRNLYSEYAELRYRIGMVPQDDVLHRQLTVKRALRFSASLRFADDVPRSTRNARVDEVIGLLGLKERANQRIDTLSGGQRKRTSVALELLTEPSLLTLDEPTSGLDPALDREVMRELRDLADRGRTVLVVTHSVLHLSMCDRILVMCLGGKMGFFGPPDEVLEFFGAKDYADVFEMITSDAPAWAVRYRNSEQYRRHVGEVLLQLTAAGPATQVPTQPGPAAAPDATMIAPPVVPDPVTDVPDAAAIPADPAAGVVPGQVGAPAPGAPPTAGPVAPKMPRRKLRPVAPLRQLVTLAGRMLAVIGSDRGYAGFLLGLPLALALLSRAVPGSNGLASVRGFNLEAERILVVLVVGASFLGIAVAIREIVNEASIYGRERAVGVSPGAYLASKLLVFLVIDIIQVTLFVWLSLLGKPMPSHPLIFPNMPLLEIIIPVTLVAFVSTVIGLLASALVKTVEQTTPILVVSVMAQLVLSGGLFELSGQPGLEQVSWLVPTRWGFADGAATVDLQKMVPTIQDALWNHNTGAWWWGICVMLIQAVVLIGLTRLALRKHEPGKK